MLYGIGVTKSSDRVYGFSGWNVEERTPPEERIEPGERRHSRHCKVKYHREVMKQTRGRCKSRAACKRVSRSRSRPFVYLREREVGFELEWLLSLARVHGSACCRSRVKKMLLEVAPLNTLRGQRNRTPHAKLSLRASPARSSPTIVVRLLGVDLPSTETTHPDLCSLHAPSQDSANRSASEGVLGAMVRPASVSPLVLTPLLNSPPPLYSLQHWGTRGKFGKVQFHPLSYFCRPVVRCKLHPRGRPHALQPPAMSRGMMAENARRGGGQLGGGRGGGGGGGGRVVTRSDRRTRSTQERPRTRLQGCGPRAPHGTKD